ncbi:MAG: NupC/NupG family nucleoside CNT transporter, partial [Cyclobacteriaceae bacterium]|nr:NupC/NupG family nucleoside CNT transporter [Cyclobacteriaceae bacterium]
MDILKGILGISVIILISFLFSNNKGLIKWRIVMSGILLQVVIAILVFKVPLFNQFLMAISGAFVKFLGFGLDGAAFLFGDLVRNSDAAPGVRHGLGFLFAFQALPIVIFFSSVAAALYYLGVLQKIVKAFAWVMSRTMKLSGAESLSAAGNIFLGQTEAPLLVRPFIAGMSQSELHCIMVGGMATIAG